MTDFITVTGTLGTEPEHKVVGDATDRVTFRLASSERRRNESTNTWEDTHTNWYSVTCFGSLARNVKTSFSKGQRVMVSGKFRLRTFERDDKSRGTSAEIIAANAGHDLTFQTASANRRANANAREEADDFRPAAEPDSHAEQPSMSDGSHNRDAHGGWAAPGSVPENALLAAGESVVAPY